MATRYRYASRRRRNAPRPSRNIGMGILPMGRSDQPRGIAQAAAAPQPGILAVAPPREGLAEMVTGLAQAQGERQEAEIERRARAIEAAEARKGRITEIERRAELETEQARTATEMRREELAQQPSPLVTAIMSRRIESGEATPDDLRAYAAYEQQLREPQEERPPGFEGPPRPTPAETFVETITQAGRPRPTGTLEELPEIFGHFDEFDPDNLDLELESWSDKALQKYTPDQIVGAIIPLYREQLLEPWGGYKIRGQSVLERRMWGWRVNRKVENARKTLRAHLLKKIDGTE